MTIAVWKTGHEIADTVADALAEGLNGSELKDIRGCLSENRGGRRKAIEGYTCHLAYGILRGTSEIFTAATSAKIPWFNVDRGYWKPGHYDGYYRISLRSTQQTIGLDRLEPDYERFDKLGIELKPWRGFDDSKPVLVCSPTTYVRDFFDCHDWEYCNAGPLKNFVIRHKDDPSPINFDDYNYVLTFNSSVGWQAMAAGIPCVSDPMHSIVGKWFADISLADLSHAQYADRYELFAVMGGLQLTTKEIREGHLCPLLSKLCKFTSGGTLESPSQAMSLHTAS